MAEDQLAFGIVRGAPEELFIQITMDAGLSTIKHTSHPMTEGALRMFLQQHGSTTSRLHPASGTRDSTQSNES